MLEPAKGPRARTTKRPLLELADNLDGKRVLEVRNASTPHVDQHTSLASRTWSSLLIFKHCTKSTVLTCWQTQALKCADTSHHIRVISALFPQEHTIYPTRPTKPSLSYKRAYDASIVCLYRNTAFVCRTRSSGLHLYSYR
jgi:hypothetical protein